MRTRTAKPGRILAVLALLVFCAADLGASTRIATLRAHFDAWWLVPWFTAIAYVDLEAGGSLYTKGSYYTPNETVTIKVTLYISHGVTANYISRGTIVVKVGGRTVINENRDRDNGSYYSFSGTTTISGAQTIEMTLTASCDEQAGLTDTATDSDSLILDQDAPTSRFNEISPVSPYLYGDYFNPAIPTGVTFNTFAAEDDAGVGNARNRYRYQHSIGGWSSDVHATTEPSYPLSLSGVGGDVSITWGVYDWLSNHSNQAHMLFRDHETPLLDNISYSVEPASSDYPNWYIVTMTVDTHDQLTVSSHAGSGLPQDAVELRFPPDTSGRPMDNFDEVVALPTLGFTKEADGTYQAKVGLQANTTISPTLHIKDNVKNELKVEPGSGQGQNPRLILSFPGNPQLENATNISWEADGKAYLNLVLSTGSSFEDEVKGFDTLTVRVGDIGTFNLRESPHANPGPPDENGVVTVHYDPILLSNIAAHGTYSIGGTYEFDGSGVLNWGGDYNVTVSNRPLSPANEIDLRIVRSGTDTTDLGSSTLLTGTPTSYTDVFFNGPLSLELSTPTDVEGDALSVYWYLNGIKQSAVNGVLDLSGIAGGSGNSVDSVRIEEEWPGGSVEYTLPYRFTKDTDLALDENNHDFSVVNESSNQLSYAAGADDSFMVGLKEVSPDTSGISRVMIFNADGMVTGGTLDTSRFDPAEATDITASRQGDTWSGSISVSPTPTGQEATHYIGVYVEDRAGNTAFAHRTVLVDKKPPRPFDVEVALVESTDEVTYQGGQSQIRLVASAEAKDTNLTDDHLQPISLAAYGLKWTLPAGSLLSTSGSTTGPTVSLAVPPTGAGNQRCSISLTITDYVGNSTTQEVAFYTPAKLTESVDKYLAESAEEKDGGGGYKLEWDALASPDAASYRLYRGETVLADFIDVNVAAHQQVQYHLYGINGSGYKSAFEGSYVSFSRTVRNNPPAGGLAVNGSATGLSGTMVLGLNSTIDIGTYDYDGDQLFLITVANGQPWSKVELSGSGNDSLVLAQLTGSNVWQNRQTYGVKFSVQDEWATGSGAPVETGAVAFTYDSQGPALARHHIQARPNYSVGYGDLILEIADEFVAVTSVSARLASGFPLTVADSDGGIYAVTDLPSGRNMQVLVTAVDELGNSTENTISALYKDAVAPGIVSAQASFGSWNGAHVTNRPTIPLVLQWGDTHSGLRKIGVEVRQGDQSVEVFEYDTNAADPLVESGSWQGTIPLQLQPQEGLPYTLLFRVLDRAGNESAWLELDRPLHLDFRAPVASIADASGFVSYQGKTYLTDAAVSFRAESTDGLAIAGSRVRLLDPNGAEIAPNISGAELGALAAEGGLYAIQAVAVDVAGNSGESEKLWFTADRLAPDGTNAALSLSNPNTFGDEVLQFSISATDAASGVSAVSLEIGQLVEGTFQPTLSREIPGHDADGAIHLVYHGPSYLYGLGLPAEADPGTYAFRLRLEDGVGNKTELLDLPGTALVIAPAGERLVVRDYLAVTNNPHRLQATWRYFGGNVVSFYQYRVVNRADGAPVSEWTDTFDTYATVDFATALANNGLYVFQVRATRDDGLQLPIFVSAGTRVDTAAPVATALSVPRHSRPERLEMGWQVREHESLLVSMELELSGPAKDASGNVVYEDVSGESVPVPVSYGVIPLAPLESADAYGMDLRALHLPLDDGDALHLRLRAVDEAGNTMDVSAGTVILDGSPPPAPVVADQGDFVNPDRNTLSFDWAFSAQDQHSGTSRYRYQLLEADAPLDPGAWASLDAATPGVTLSTGAPDGGTLVLAVEATNGAGASQVGYSNGIVIDRSRPEIPAAWVGKPGAPTPAQYLVSSAYQLHMSSQDQQSGVVGYQYQLGILDEGGVWRFKGAPGSVDKDHTIVNLDAVSAGLAPGDRFAYRVQALNGAGDFALLPGMTSSVLYNPVKPAVKRVLPLQVQDGIDLTWSVETGGIPIASTTIVLNRLGSADELARAVVDGDPGTYRFEVAGLADGVYRARVTVTNLEGQISEPTALSTAGVVFDRTAPVFELTRFDRYVSDHMSVEFRARDALSGIAEYRYRLGVAGAPEQVSGGWISAPSRLNVLVGQINLGGAVTHLDSLVLSYQVRDIAGNWSLVEYGEPALADLTAPAVYVLFQDPRIMVSGEPWLNQGVYVVRPNTAERLGFQVLDSESGVTAYRYAFVQNDAQTPDVVTWSDYYQIQDDPVFATATSVSHVAFTRQEGFADSQVWRLLLQVKNRSGLVSTIAELPDLLVDLSAPVVSLDTEHSGAAVEPGSQEGSRPVFNTAGDLRLNIDNEAGEVVAVDYVLRSPQGAHVGHGGFVQPRAMMQIKLPFAPAEQEDSSGVYLMEVDVTDHGERTSKLLQEIRYNAAPTLMIEDKETRPGALVRFDGADVIFDADGIQEMRVTVLDGAQNVINDQAVSDRNAWQVALYHQDPRAGQTEYTVRVTARDTYGQESSAESKVTVRNTRSGTLYVSEYWSAEHRITGPVVVPAGITLTVTAGTRVMAVPGLEGELPGLTVLAGGVLVHEGAAEYTLESLVSDATWAGLAIYGQAQLSGITVRGARRGIAVLSNNVAPMVGVRVESNVTGVHVVGVSVEIRDSFILSNRYYGIKEDRAGSVRLIDNAFSSNGWDYYQDGGALLSPADLNRIRGNRGNTGE